MNVIFGNEKQMALAMLCAAGLLAIFGYSVVHCLGRMMGAW